jgi:predicted flap endonuclease-1-like 5' DNA nuclease
MGSLGCCVIWFLVGALLGWLLNYWLSKRCCKKPKETTSPPAAKMADAPVASVTPTEKAPAPAKAAPKKAAAKPKTVAATKSVIDLAAAKAAGIAIKNADDLTVIEGIGPKINELFKDNGLNTFAQVGDATVTQMRAILDKGGARYRMANPGTWAKQAKLAANNKWTELKKLQDELSGGKKK